MADLVHNGTRPRSPSPKSSISTAEIAIQAGLPSKKRRAIHLVVFALGVVAFLTAGVVLLSRHLGEPSSTAPAVTSAASRSPTGGSAVVDADDPRRLSAGEARKIHRIFGLGDASPYAGSSSAQDRKQTAERAKRRAQLLAFYQGDEKQEILPQRSSVQPAQPAPQSVELSGGGVSLAEPSAPSKGAQQAPGPRRPMAVAQPLSDEQIRGVVRRYYPQIKRRLELLMSRDPSIAGKLYLVVRVRPSGRVEGVRVETPRFQGSAIGEFLAGEVRRWKFPPFRGKTAQLRFPILLTKTGH